MRLWIWACLIFAVEAQAGELDRGVTRLVDELELPAIPGFSPAMDLAVVVLSESPGSPTVRGVTGLLRARLYALGVKTVLELDPAANDAETERRARDAGAELLLVVRAQNVAGKLSLESELRGIDRGLWVRSEKAAIYATAEETIDDAGRGAVAIHTPALTVEEPAEGLRFEGAPQRIATLTDRVMAIASCDVGLPGGETLFVLTKRWLYAYLYSGTGYAKKAAALELYNLERSKERTREPFGVLSCGSARELALGSSELKDGQLVRAKMQGQETILGVTRTFTGWPIGEISPGKWAFAHVDAGRARLSASIELEGGGKKSLEAPVLEMVVDRGRAVALTERYRVVRFSEELDAPVVIGTSGVGMSLFDAPAELLVATSSAAKNRDRLRLLPFDRSKKERRSVELDGAIHATTVAKMSAELRAVIAAAYRDGKTEIFALPLKGAPR